MQFVSPDDEHDKLEVHPQPAHDTATNKEW